MVAPPPLGSEGGEIEELKGGCPPTSCSESSFVDGVYQNKCLHPILPDDPRAALVEVARFIRGMRDCGAMKGYYPVGCKPAFIEGFIIDHAWLYELDGVASEAERVACLHAHSGE